MARTPLARVLRDIASTAAESVTRGVPEEQVIEERRERALSRRELLRLGAAAAVASAFGAPGRPALAQGPRIAVVGAGLAGLTCAYRLTQSGYPVTLYEGSSRIGGRCWTLRGAFDEGQLIERGGELIDQSHTAIRQLAQSLGLTLDNLLQAEPNGSEPFYYFDGAPYTYTEATRDIKAAWQKIQRDVSQASYPTLYNLSTERGRQLDQLSIVDWINESIPGGISSRLGQLLDVAYTIEYGGDSAIQSSLNLLYLLGYSGQGQLRIFGPSNEKYHVRGGNDQITDRMAAALAGRIQVDHSLAAIRRNSDGTFTLSFSVGRGTRDVVADRVVLAIPFSVLRERVDYRRAGFKPLKETAIRELSMGTNVKFHLQFRTRHWYGLGCNGDSCTDQGYQNTWEVTRGQPGTAGILVNYTGGTVGAGYSAGTPEQRASTFLSQIEPVLPGLSTTWNGKTQLEYWPSNPWALGSYAYWRVGQYTRFAGVEREREGNCHFAGEHTSVDFQGYLNGAVETGERAAGEIMADLR